MGNKERALLSLESELESIIQTTFCSNECYLCPHRNRLKALLGQTRIIMDYSNGKPQKTLTTFQIKKWGAGKKKNKHNNLRVKKEPHQNIL